MANLGTGTGPSLFQDWYDQYVAPRKKPISLTSTQPQDLSLGLPASPTPTPEAPVPSPAGYSDAGIQAPERIPAGGVVSSATHDAVSPPTDPSFMDKVNKGLQNPATMGLLGAGLSMMATPPRAVPYSTAEIIGRGGQAGIGYYEKALEDKRRQQALDESMEEKKLTREDRRTAAEDRGQYYRDVAETRRLTAESQAEARKATAAENTVLDVPIDPAVAKHYGVDSKMTVRTFNKMQAGLTAMAKPEKETKTDAFTKWYEAKVAEKGKVTAKDLEEWHRKPGSEAGGEGPGKTGATAQVNSLVTSHYFADAKKNLESKGPAGTEELKGIIGLFGTADSLGGPVSMARIRQALTPEKQKEFDYIIETAQEYSKTMVPAKAMAKAKKDWVEQNPAPKAPNMNQRYNEFKSVYEEIRASSLTTEQKTAKLKELSDYARSQGLIQ